MIHTLKIVPPFFEAIVNGSKTFELRREDDRHFEVGDWLLLREYIAPFRVQGCVVKERYTGRACNVQVTYVLRDEQWLQPGVAALGIRLANAEGIHHTAE